MLFELETWFRSSSAHFRRSFSVSWAQPRESTISKMARINLPADFKRALDDSHLKSPTNKQNETSKHTFKDLGNKLRIRDAQF